MSGITPLVFGFLLVKVRVEFGSGSAFRVWVRNSSLSFGFSGSRRYNYITNIRNLNFHFGFIFLG